MTALTQSGAPSGIWVAVAVAGLVVAYAWPRRPRARRRLRRHDEPLAGLGGTSSASTQIAADQHDQLEIDREIVLPKLPTIGTRRRLSANPLMPLGRWLRRAARRPSDPDADKRLGIVVATGVATGLLVEPWLGLIVAAAVAGTQHWRRRRRLAIAEEQIADALPDVIDLLRVAVSAGCTVPIALMAVARRAPPAIGPGLRETIRRHALGMPLADALDAIVGRHGDVVRPMVQVLVAADRDGAPLGPGLERLAADLRIDRRRRADIAARRLPIALLFPLVLCTLPAFGLLTIAPLLVTALQALHH